MCQEAGTSYSFCSLAETAAWHLCWEACCNLTATTPALFWVVLSASVPQAQLCRVCWPSVAKRG